MRSFRHALLWTLILTTALSPVLGCVFVDYSGVRVRLAEQRSASLARYWLPRVEGRDRQGGAYAVAFSPLRLLQPFDAEARWSVDPARTSESHEGQACVEVDDLTSDTRQLLAFYTVCGQYLAASALGAGILYYVRWNGVTGQQLFVPGQTEIGLRAAMVAGVLSFLVLQGAQMVSLDQRAVSPLGVLYFATGVSLLAYGAAFLMLGAQLHQIGALPGTATLEEQIAYELGLGFFLLLAAVTYLHGPTAEWTLATSAVLAFLVQLAVVDALLDDAALNAAARQADRGANDGLRRAERQLRRSFRHAKGALSAIAKGKQKGAVKKALKAARAAGEASHRVQPFRLAVGS